jgi:lysine decarboxylase
MRSVPDDPPLPPLTAAAGSPDWLADAPLFAAWRRFASGDAAPFTIPGHKRRAGLLHPDLARLLDADVPLYGGADTVKLASGVLAEAERRAAALWGADHCRFSTGGSTHANLVACLSVGRPGDTVLVARNAHRSVLSGLALAGLRPRWLTVDLDPRTGAPLGPAVATVAAALDAHPGAAALFLTEPGYQGALSDLPALADAAHARDAAVVVDQAWGAHLGFAAGYPQHALQAGADLMVTSAHKMLPAFSQAALVLARTGRIDRDRLERAFEATHTTSPSAAILASIDASRALLASEAGRDALARTAGLVAGARRRLAGAGLHVPDPADHPAGRFDPAKFVIHFGPSGRSGLSAEDALLARGIPVEMADRDTLVAQVGLVDDEGTLDRLVEGVLASLAGPAGSPRPPRAWQPPVPPQRMAPREASVSAFESVPRHAAIGRTSAELVAPYPPGVPLLVPGEEVTAATLAALDEALAAGNRIAYAADPGLARLQVVREDPAAVPPAR